MKLLAGLILLMFILMGIALVYGVGYWFMKDIMKVRDIKWWAPLIGLVLFCLSCILVGGLAFLMVTFWPVVIGVAVVYGMVQAFRH